MEIDRRSPMQRVIITYQNVDDQLMDKLECGHEINIQSKDGFNFAPAKQRRCKECAKGVKE